MRVGGYANANSRHAARNHLPSICVRSLTAQLPWQASLRSRSQLLRPSTMVDDKYIGLALACSSSLAIGTSFILTKKVRRLLQLALSSDSTEAMLIIVIPLAFGHCRALKRRERTMSMSRRLITSRISKVRYGGRACRQVCSPISQLCVCGTQLAFFIHSGNWRKSVLVLIASYDLLNTCRQLPTSLPISSRLPSS